MMRPTLLCLCLVTLVFAGCNAGDDGEDVGSTDSTESEKESLELAIVTVIGESEPRRFPIEDFDAIESEFKRLDWTSSNRNSGITISRPMNYPNGVVLEAMSIYPSRHALTSGEPRTDIDPNKLYAVWYGCGVRVNQINHLPEAVFDSPETALEILRCYFEADPKLASIVKWKDPEDGFVPTAEHVVFE